MNPQRTPASIGAALLAAGALAAPAPALAELYRWRDPATGSTRYSNFPPPWFKDGVNAPRQPRVEVVQPPAWWRPPAAPADAPPPVAATPPDDGGEPPAAGLLEALTRRRSDLLAGMLGLPTKADATAASNGFAQHLAAYDAVAQELDRIDPAGAARRRAQQESVLDKMKAGLKAKFGVLPDALTGGKR